MGQLIGFNGKSLKKNKAELKEADIISLLPYLRNLKGEIIVVNITKKVIDNDELLKKLLREIVTIKCMGAVVIIVPDGDFQINNFCEEIFDKRNYLDNFNYVNTQNQVDILDVFFKREVVDKISNILKSFNAMSIGVSGHSLDIILPDDVVNPNASLFDKQNKKMYNGMSEKTGKKYSIDMLEELIKTDIIPIVYSTFKTRNGNIYAMESSLFGAYIATYLSSLKYVEVYTDEQNIPTSCMYGVEKFVKIVKTGNFSKNQLRIINSGLEAVKNGIQGTHILDMKYVSLLEEFCGKSFSGLFLYDDTLNQI